MGYKYVIAILNPKYHYKRHFWSGGKSFRFLFSVRFFGGLPRQLRPPPRSRTWKVRHGRE